MIGCLAATGPGGIRPWLLAGVALLLLGAVCLVVRPRRRAVPTPVGMSVGLVVVLVVGGTVAGPAPVARATDGDAGTVSCPSAGSTGTPARAPSTAIGGDTEITYVSGGVTVHGSYRGPVDPARPVPAVVIVGGTGAVDRNGDAPGLATGAYRWLADRLSDLGIASLRYDKLGTGATGLGPYAADPSALLAHGYDELRVQPVRDALTFVAGQPGIDTDRLLLLGHSEGGPLALTVTTDRREAPAVAGLLLIEPAYTRILDILGRQVQDQAAAAVTGGALSAADEKALADWMDLGRAEIRAGDVDPPPVAPPLPTATGYAAELQTSVGGNFWGSDPAQMVVSHAYRTRYGREYDAIDPAHLATEVIVPTLITCGTKDFNTPCGDGSPGSGVAAVAADLDPALATFVRLPDTVHLLRDITTPGVPAPAEQITRPYSGVLVDALTDFLTHF
ncbi:alpha/beta hydrolase [Nakamurella flavida]|uniref:Alpha/beta hydrolase n=1 Tax=Nakamurella flavida TaxID=363630 RepID=A0A938YGY2_9ACTN|nr:alpha/beta hydrolase fold domain-containing protein [Nakamurella flavida]MBM9477486.1 alpha/beta hydrolase [Nakamurella flavida]MDP9777419.1 alpha-beta hydrolase superfamily lysophospholipase [Nakamurella flavida]